MDIDDDINELSLLEFIHNLVETLDKYFENVCELDVSMMADFSAYFDPHLWTVMGYEQLIRLCVFSFVSR